MMFSFVVLRAYLSFSQWIIIWSGKLLWEIRWYLIRLNGGWQYFGTILILVHFVCPFSLLLSRNLKRHGTRVMRIALLVICMRLVDLFWITAPNFYPGHSEGGAGLVNFVWVDAARWAICPIALGGSGLVFFVLC